MPAKRCSAVSGSSIPPCATILNYRVTYTPPVLSTKALFAAAQTEWEYRPLPVYPAVERDLALVMDVATEAGVVEDAIRSYAGKSLCGVTVFDVYTGKGVADGRKAWPSGSASACPIKR